jgi:hypothetical protein
MKELFNKNFIDQLIVFLNEECADGSSITRKNICKHFGIHKEFESTIGAIIKTGILDGFDIKRGPSGGVYKLGTEAIRPIKKANSPSTPAARVDEAFVELLTATLERLCIGDACVSRKVIAKVMGLEGLSTEQKISRALKSGQLKGYESRTGIYGGIRRKPQPPSGQSDDSDEPFTSQRVIRGRLPFRAKLTAKPNEEEDQADNFKTEISPPFRLFFDESQELNQHFSSED